MAGNVPEQDYTYLEIEAAGSRPPRLALGVAFGATIATLGSLQLPWLGAGFGGDSVAYSGLQLLPAGIPVAIAALITTFAAVVGVRGAPGPARLGIAASCVSAAIAAATIMLSEMTALAPPVSVLPRAIDGAAQPVGAGYGVWLALLGSVTAAIALHGQSSGAIVRRLRFSRHEWRRVPGVLALVTLTALIGWLRYQAWIDASLLGGHLPLPALAAPWIGPLSLTSVLMLVGAMGLAAFSNAQLAGLVAASAGWLTSFVAALVVLSGGSFGLGVEGSSFSEGPLGVHATAFVWVAFLAGLTAAGVGAFLVHSPVDRTA